MNDDLASTGPAALRCAEAIGPVTEFLDDALATPILPCSGGNVSSAKVVWSTLVSSQ